MNTSIKFRIPEKRNLFHITISRDNGKSKIISLGDCSTLTPVVTLHTENGAILTA